MVFAPSPTREGFRAAPGAGGFARLRGAGLVARAAARLAWAFARFRAASARDWLRAPPRRGTGGSACGRSDFFAAEKVTKKPLRTSRF